MGVILALVVFLTIWMALTFTNTLCDGMVGIGLCYNKSINCPACPAAPAPKAPSPCVRSPTTSCYEPEPFVK